MKFTITREQLQEGLSAVAAAIPAKTTLPVLANVLVEVTKQGLRLSGTDLDIAVSTTVPAEVDAEGAVTLPAKKLVDIARELPSGPVRITAAGESRVGIECGRSKFKLLGLPREEFPSFPAVKFDGAWKAAAGVVHKLVGHVAFAASTEESRPILNGVLWELRPDRMRMVATNGHRLAKMDVPAKGGSTADLIVPPKALEQIRRLFAADDAIEVAKSDNHIGFRAGGTLVFSRLIEGPYPNYEQVIPRENDKAATVDKAAMAAALRRMSVVASDQTHRIRLAFAGGAVKFSVQTPDLGEAEGELALQGVRRWHGDRRHLQRVRFLCRRDVHVHAIVAGENQVASRQHALGPHRWGRRAGMGERCCERRRLRLVEPGRGHAEVRAARRVRAPHARAPFRGIEIELEDPVLGQRELEAQRRYRLLELPQGIARRREVQVFRELLCDRARAAQPLAVAPHRGDRPHRPVAPVRAERVRNLGRVDAVVGPKPRILSDDDHALQHGGDGSQGGRMDRWSVGTFRPSIVPTFRFPHHGRFPRPVTPPPQRRRPDAEHPDEREPRRP